ncbi:hypothetical protein BGW39_000986, partial [Mortierella sp. 14UC]
NCERLEYFNINDCDTGGLSGAHLQMILKRAPRLRSLQAHWVLGTDKLSHLDILSSEWATTTLTHIDLKVHVPRIIVVDDEAEVDSEALQSSRNIQRQVLRRLGQQTHHRRIIVGGMASNPGTNVLGIQSHCLEMTLEAGLDELGRLKKLKLLDIHHMNVRTGVPELEWMVANFPKLQMVTGLKNCLRPVGEDVLEWLQVHQPDWD